VKTGITTPKKFSLFTSFFLFLISSYGTGKPEHILFVFYLIDALCKPLAKSNIHARTSLKPFDSSEVEETEKRQAFRELFNQKINTLLMIAVSRLTPGTVLVHFSFSFSLSLFLFLTKKFVTDET
jgi:hypothetical protein